MRMGSVIVLACMAVLVCACGRTDVLKAQSDDGTTVLGNVPRSLSWANIDLNGDGIGENYVTSIKAQPCEDCSFYAALALVETRWQIDNGLNASLNLSEQNLHNCMKVTCDGTSDTWLALNHVRDWGVLPEENMPTGHWTSKCENCVGLVFSGIGILPVQSAPFYRIKKYDMFPVPKEYSKRKNMLVQLLQEGPAEPRVGRGDPFGQSGRVQLGRGRVPEVRGGALGRESLALSGSVRELAADPRLAAQPGLQVLLRDHSAPGRGVEIQGQQGLGPGRSSGSRDGQAQDDQGDHGLPPPYRSITSR